MSTFQCDKCGAVCIDTPQGYTTGCEHYPVEVQDETATWLCPHCQTPREVGYDFAECCEGGQIAALQKELDTIRARYHTQWTRPCCTTKKEDA